MLLPPIVLVGDVAVAQQLLLTEASMKKFTSRDKNTAWAAQQHGRRGVEVAQNGLSQGISSQTHDEIATKLIARNCTNQSKTLSALVRDCFIQR
jgi:hypothetical protein